MRKYGVNEIKIYEYFYMYRNTFMYKLLMGYSSIVTHKVPGLLM